MTDILETARRPWPQRLDVAAPAEPPRVPPSGVLFDRRAPDLLRYWQRQRFVEIASRLAAIRAAERRSPSSCTAGAR